MFQHFHCDDPAGKTIFNRQRGAVSDDTARVPGGGASDLFVQTLDIGRVQITVHHLGSVASAEKTGAARPAANIDHDIFGGNREATKELAGLGLIPASLDRVFEADIAG